MTTSRRTDAHRPSTKTTRAKNGDGVTRTEKKKPVASTTTTTAKKPAADTIQHGGRKLEQHTEAQPAAAGSRRAGVVAVRAGVTTPSADVIHSIATRAQFDSMFAQGASVTAGAPTELKFLIDRKTKEVFFIPPKYPFHFNFYRDVLHGTLDNAAFDQVAYNRPERTFIAGTVTDYESYVDPTDGKKGVICYSLWPTDKFDPKLLEETHNDVKNGLAFLDHEDIDFRPGGPKQDKLVASEANDLKSEGIVIKDNLEISKGLKYMALSKGTAMGKLVIIDQGAAMPELGRTDVALFLGDVPPIAPPVAAIITTTVQTFNSHLGIKYRQDKTPYFYKAFSDDELTKLKALAGKPVEVNSSPNDGTITGTTPAKADEYLKSVKPKGRIRLVPNLKENKARSFSDLAKISVGKNGKWAKAVLASYGRKTLGVVQLAQMEKDGKLNVSAPGEPKVVTPKEPMGIPANWYTRFIRAAKDKNGVTFSDRIKTMTKDPRFASDLAWRTDTLKDLRKAIEKADMPADLLKDIHDQVAIPYMATHPGDTKARFRSSSPVVEDSGPGKGTNKLPNMAGAFESHSAKWDPVAGDATKTAANCAAGMADALQKEYASVWDDRAISELLWHNADMDEGSVAMAVCVMPNEEDEKANGVIRKNSDLAGFFSVTGETQFGENLVTNPEQGATPDTWIDGNYDQLDGEDKQDIEYERVSNQKSTDPARKDDHAYTDREISVVYKAMKAISEHFAKLEGKDPADYVDECETKVLKDGTVQFKQERPWVE